MLRMRPLTVTITVCAILRRSHVFALSALVAEIAHFAVAIITLMFLHMGSSGILELTEHAGHALAGITNPECVSRVADATTTIQHVNDCLLRRRLCAQIEATENVRAIRCLAARTNTTEQIVHRVSAMSVSSPRPTSPTCTRVKVACQALAKMREAMNCVSCAAQADFPMSMGCA